MAPAACLRIFRKYSVLAGVLTRWPTSLAYLASLIVRAGYRLLPALSSEKPFSFSKSINVRNTLTRQIINRYGANVSPCHNVKKSTFLHPVSVLLLSCFYRASLGLLWSLWVDRRLEVFPPYSLCVWSQIP